MNWIFKAMACLTVCVTNSCDNGSSPPHLIGNVSTAKFSYAGRQITQKNGVACEYVNLSDGVVHIGRAPFIVGDRHWLKRADGSIIIFPEFETCMDNARDGDQRDVMTVRHRFAPLSDTTYVFNNSDQPSRVDLLTADAFTSASDQVRLTSVTLTRIDSQVTNTLAAAFPGLEKMVPDPDKMAPNGLGSDISPSMFVGVQAEATILAPNTVCGTTASSGLVVLPDQDECRFVNDCRKSAPKLVCGKHKGGLKVTYNATFSRATVSPGAPDKQFRVTLYNSQLPVFSSALRIAQSNSRKWVPEVCVEALCSTPKEPYLPVLFYYPARRLLLEVGLVKQAFRKGMFSDRRML